MHTPPQLIHGNSLNELKQLSDNSIDSCVCDPPYELGFMGKKWDNQGIAYNVNLWKEVLRVLKPGGHLLAFGGTRTYHRMTCAIEDAGFEIRDSLHWIYGQGFPKSHDVSKAIDGLSLYGHSDSLHLKKVNKTRPGPVTVRKSTNNGNNGFVSGVVEGSSEKRNSPATSQGKQWSGWGTALKPAHEPIVVARKPLNGTVAANVLKHGTGGINVDGCRVDTLGSGEQNPSIQRRLTAQKTGNSPGRPGEYGDTIVSRITPERYTEERPGEHLGRWPPNILLSHSEECKCVGTKKVKTGTHVGENRNPEEVANKIYGKYQKDTSNQTYAGSDGLEEIPSWECVPGCPVREMDLQSGVRKNGSKIIKRQTAKGHQGTAFGKESRPEGTECPSYGDTGSASRYFPQLDPTDTTPPFLYSPKASKKERHGGSAAEDQKNSHPTVKPVTVMRWLCRLVTPPNGTVLDPFMGSGTTGIAAHLEGFRFVGIELEKEYYEIAEKRITHHCCSPSPPPPSTVET